MATMKKKTVKVSSKLIKKVELRAKHSGEETKRAGQEINDIFGDIRSEKRNLPAESSKTAKIDSSQYRNSQSGSTLTKIESVKNKSQKLYSSNDDSLEYGKIKSEYGNFVISPEAPLERIDSESGLPVYKAHLLKVGEGGGTELCPFDCSCCF